MNTQCFLSFCYFILFFFLFCPSNFCVSLIPLKYMLTAQTHFIRSEYLGFYAVKKMKKKTTRKKWSRRKGKKKENRFFNTQPVSEYSDGYSIYWLLNRFQNTQTRIYDFYSWCSFLFYFLHHFKAFNSFLFFREFVRTNWCTSSATSQMF